MASPLVILKVEAVGKSDFLNKVDLQSRDNLFMA